MKKIYLLLTISIFLTQQSFSQVPGIKWQKCIGGSWNEAMFDLNGEANASLPGPTQTKSLIPAKEGGYFIAGQTNSSDGDLPVNSVYNQPGTIAVLRLDENRNIVWKKTLGGLDNTVSGKYDQFRSIIQTTDRGCIVMGETKSTTGQASGNHGKDDIIIGKFSSSGDLEWSKMYGGTEIDNARNIVQTTDGGYVFLGITYSTSGQVQGNHGLSDVWMVKINKTGNIEWQKCIGTANYDNAVKIEKIANGGFVYFWQGANCTGFTITKTDSLGNPVSEGCVSGLEAIGGISATNDGGYILSGQGANSSGTVVKIDSLFNTQWQKALNGSKTDMFNDARQTPDGGYIIGGNSESTDGDLTGLGSHACSGCMFPKSDAWIIKLDTAGTIQWQKLLGGSKGEAAVTILPTSGEEYIFLGLSNSSDGDVTGIHNNGDTAYNPTVDWWLVNLSATNTIKGHVFEDKNRNGVKDAGEGNASNVRIKSAKGAIERVTIPSNGQFSNFIDTGTYITSITPFNPYYSVVPSTHTTSFSSYNNIDSFDIALLTIPGKRDLSISLFSTVPPRPGFDIQYKLLYKNQGTDTIANGTVQFIKDDKLTLTSADPAYTSMRGNTLEWNYTGLKPQDNGVIVLHFTVAPPPLVNIGDLVTSMASITPVATDLTPTDDTANLVQTVTGSFDPNGKWENHAGVLKKSELSKGEYLLYTIGFQNTGTDTAFNVVVRDTLSNKVDWNSFEMISTSHSYQLNIKDGNTCSWSFKNIRLVDSNRNEPASHGYISYRIKPSRTLAAGDTINNIAGIYFDFNLPVATNLERTIVEASVLPLKLLSFEAQRSGKTNKIQWSTVNEINIKTFEIEKSSDGRTFFAIGKVVPGSNNGTSNQYEISDDQPSTAVNFYRLKITNKDGSVSYSVIRIVDNSVSYSISVFPNPAKTILFLQIKSEKKTNVQIDIVTMDGKTIATSKAILLSGSNSRNINVTAMPAGTYFVSVKSTNEQSVIKFEKL